MFKRPGLYEVRAILQSIEKSKPARYSALCFATPAMRNRKRMREYLELLCELGWIQKTSESKETLWNPFKQTRLRRWQVEVYSLTDRGTTFLKLFPQENKAFQIIDEEEPPAKNEEEYKYAKWI